MNLLKEQLKDDYAKLDRPDGRAALAQKLYTLAANAKAHDARCASSWQRKD